MPEFRVASFRLEQDINPLCQMLKQRQIEFKIEQEDNEQVLFVDSAEIAAQLKQVVADLTLGSIEIVGYQTEDKDIQYAVKSTLNLRSWSVTAIVLAVSAFVFLLTDILQIRQVHYALTFLPLNTLPPQKLETWVNSGEFWRLFSPAILHFGWVHILFNSATFYFAGRRLEVFLGKVKYVVLLFMLAFLANVVEYNWDGGLNFGGLSGVIFGLFGFIGAVSLKKPAPVLYLPRGIYIVLLLSIVVGTSGILGILFNVFIANGAHIGGLVSGIILGTFYGDYLNRHAEKAA